MLRNKVVYGFVWNAISVFGHGAGYILITIVLSRFKLLPPSDFGLAALLLVFSSVSSVLVDGGFGQAVIRDKNISNEKLSSVFLFNIGIAFSIYAVLFLSSPLLCSFYSITEHLWKTRLFFSIIVFDALSIIQKTLIVRNMDFRWLGVAQCCATFIAGITAITLALLKCGTWSLIIYYVTYSLLQTIILWCKRYEWKPRFQFSFRAIREYFSFSLYLLLTSFVDRVMGNLESAFIGKIYTKSDLAFFTRARELDAWTGQNITNTIVKVTYPALAQTRDDQQRFSAAYRNVMGVTILATSFVMFFIIFAAPNIIDFLWGNDWQETAIYVVPWCIFGIIYPFQAICINIFQAYGRTDSYLYISLARQIMRLTAIILFAKISIICMTWAIIAVATIGVSLVAYFGARLIQISPAVMLWDSRITFLTDLIGGFSVWGVGRLLNNCPLIIVLLLQGMTMSLVFFAGNYLLKNQYMVIIVKQILPMFLNKIKAS